MSGTGDGVIAARQAQGWAAVDGGVLGGRGGRRDAAELLRTVRRVTLSQHLCG